MAESSNEGGFEWLEKYAGYEAYHKRVMDARGFMFGIFSICSHSLKGAFKMDCAVLKQRCSPRCRDSVVCLELNR